MPLYEYECTKCGHRFEKIESVGASETKKCPKCGAKAVRLLAAPAIQFKGSGWYVTDYAAKNSGVTPKESADGDGTKSEKTEKADKSEKPAAKSAESKSSAKDSAKKK